MPGRRGFWIALVVFLALFSWIRFVELPRRRATSPASPESLYLAVPAIRVRAFTVAYVGDTTRVEREGSDWWVVDPVRYPADPVAVQAFLSRCEALPVGRTFPYREAEASRYGLDLPSCTALLEEVDGRTTRLIMGAPAPATPAYYVRVEGRSEVALLGEHDADSYFRRTTEEWRLRRLLRFTPGRAVVLDIRGPNERLRVERATPRDPWRVVAPFPGLASASYLAEFLKGLSFTAALSFRSEDPGGFGPFGLEPPWAEIEVVEEGGHRVALALGSDVPNVPGPPQIHARLLDQPQLFGAPAGYRDLVTHDDLEFRDRRLLRQAVTQYRALRFMAGDRDLALVPDSSGAWIDSRELARPHPVDRRELVEAWVVGLADSIVAAGPETAAWFGRPAFLVVEGAASDSRVERLEVAPARPTPGGGDSWPARIISGEPARPDEVFLIPGELIRPVLALLAR